jgi:hypothetical protein
MIAIHAVGSLRYYYRYDFRNIASAVAIVSRAIARKNTYIYIRIPKFNIYFAFFFKNLTSISSFFTFAADLERKFDRGVQGVEEFEKFSKLVYWPSPLTKDIIYVPAPVPNILGTHAIRNKNLSLE